MTKTRLLLPLTVALSALMLALPAGAGASIPAGNTGWNWSNPVPQGNSLITVKAAGGRIWAGGATGTLIHSDDFGRSWRAVRTGLLDDVRTVEAISEQSVVFAGRCALRRSDDGGMTVRRLAWSASDDGCTAEIKDVSFPTPVVGHLLLSSGDLYVTTDGGVSFEKQSVAPYSPAAGGTAEVRDIHFTSPQKGLLIVDGKVYRSINGGLTWAPVAGADQLAGAASFTFVDADNGFVTVAGGGVLRTANGGESWSPVTSLGNGGESISALACWNQQLCVASLAQGKQLARSVDGGQTWGATQTVDGNVASLAVVGGGEAIAVGGAGLVTSSSDGGASWTRADQRVAGAFERLRAVSKRSAYAFGDGGALAATNDAGKSWRQLSTGSDREVVDVAPAGRSLLVLERSGRLLRSQDGGTSWRAVTTGLSFKPTGLMVWPNGRTVFVGPRGAAVSASWGARAVRAPRIVMRARPSAVEAVGSSLFVHGRSRIVLTKNRGRSWKQIKKPRGSGSIRRLEMVSGSRGFLLDSRAELFATANGGRSWRRIETTGANAATTMAFGDTRHGYIGDSSGRILATSDGGATWSRQYPFFDAADHSPLQLVGLARRSALALVRGSSRIFETSSAGRIGQSSTLTLRPSITHARSGTVVPVTGQLRPATGVERVSVLARVKSARGGTQWVTQNVTVSASGTFTTKWKITHDTLLIARWSGDAAHDGDAAPLRVVHVRR